MANVLFILTGSIACYKACAAISQLVQRGHRVRVVATPSALKFVGAATLEGLTGNRVAHDLFAAGEALDHLELGRGSELTIVCPATANTLNRMAAGLGDDLAGALLLAHDWSKPLLVAPAMNPRMLSHPATAAALAQLQRWGARIVGGTAGRTACGDVGEGRMAEPEEIVAAIETALTPPARRLRVLITSGGTAEPLDGVRVITNTSSGGTGALIAEHFARAGHEVVLLRGRAAVRPNARCDEEAFGTCAELAAALERRLRDDRFDAIIHAAAVSDFSVEAIEVDGVRRPPGAVKLSSNAAPIVHLRKNPKLVDTLRARSENSAVRIVAFKLTRGADAAAAASAVRELFAHSGADFVVHNDLAARGDAGGVFPADIWAREGTIVDRCADRLAIGPALQRLLVQAIAETQNP